MPLEQYALYVVSFTHMLISIPQNFPPAKTLYETLLIIYTKERNENKKVTQNYGNFY